MITVLDVIKKSQNFLENKQITQARRAAEDIVSAVLNISRLDLYLEFERPLDEGELEKVRAILKRRALKEPLQYILGQVEFFGTKLKVNSNVLIPRQETELLVEKIASHLAKQNSLEGKVLWDICTGSGAIAISLKKKFPELEVYASDISKEALAVAQENAASEKVKIHFLQGSLFEPFFDQQASYIVSNPPYISESEYKHLHNEVKDFEPKLSLVSGANGLEFYQMFAASLKQYLKKPGRVWLELGYQQGKAVQKIFKDQEFDKVYFEKDYASHDRFFFLELE